MTPLLQTVLRADIVPEITRPDPDKLISGDPVQTTWNLEDDRGLYCGQWHSTPGAWRFHYDEWEYCVLREGLMTISDAQGQVTTYRAGDAFILRPGLAGVWTVIESVLKDYVILLR